MSKSSDLFIKSFTDKRSTDFLPFGRVEEEGISLNGFISQPPVAAMFSRPYAIGVPLSRASIWRNGCHGNQRHSTTLQRLSLLLLTSVNRNPILLTISRIGVVVKRPTADHQVMSSSPVRAPTFSNIVLSLMMARAYMKMGKRGSKSRMDWW